MIKKINYSNDYYFWSGVYGGSWVIDVGNVNNRE
jgi:hypothetical protein